MKKIDSRKDDKIYVYPIISSKHNSYNYVLHIINFLENIKFRKYNINTKILEPKNSKVILNQFNILSFPTFIIKKNQKHIIYSGTNINELENKLNDLLN